MITQIVGNKMSVVRETDGEKFNGVVVSTNCPSLEVQFDEMTTLEVNDKVICRTGDGVSGAIMTGTVMLAELGKATIWLTVQSMNPGVERAPRVVAPGIDVTITLEGKTYAASLCDCSESGLRVSSLVNLSIDQTIELQVKTDNEILLKCKIVRAVQSVKCDYVEMGIVILDAERIHRARWNHLVATLMEKYGMAA